MEPTQTCGKCQWSTENSNGQLECHYFPISGYPVRDKGEITWASAWPTIYPESMACSKFSQRSPMEIPLPVSRATSGQDHG